MLYTIDNGSEEPATASSVMQSIGKVSLATTPLFSSTSMFIVLQQITSYLNKFITSTVESLNSVASCCMLW